MTIEISPLPPWGESSFDILIFAAGYESRSLHILREIGDKARLRIAYVFDSTDPLSSANRQDLTADNYCEVIQVRTSLPSVIGRHFSEVTPVLRIAVDISSMSRGMMADVFAQLLDVEFFANSEIEILYSVADFSPPVAETPDVIDFAPIQQFAGWTKAPEKPVVMIIGLGYETDHGIGVMEYLDPSATFAFFPEGVDERFSKEVAKANEPLIEMLKSERRVAYPVMDPMSTYWMLRSLITSVIGSARVVLVPMGPKIFVSLCLACQREFGNEVSVWRASSHSPELIKDITAAGPVFGYIIRRNDVVSRQ